MTLSNDPSDVNPYASPAVVDDRLPLETSGDTRALLQQFRSQIHGLGGFGCWSESLFRQSAFLS